MKHRSLWKAAIGLLLAVALSCAALPALAEESTEAVLDGITQTVIDRFKNENTLYQLNEQVAVGDFLLFTVQDVLYLEDTDGMMSVGVNLLLSATEAYPEGIGVSDYDFVLAEVPDGVTDPAEFHYYYPASVYGQVAGRAQPFAWPVYAYPGEPINATFLYRIPREATRLALVNTNAMDAGDGPVVQGRLYSCGFSRHAADFNFSNDSAQAIAELYVAPSDGDGWGENRLTGAPLESGYWIGITFLGTEHEAATADFWDVKVVLASGEATFFTRVPLRELVELRFREADAAGEYVLAYGNE